MNDYLHYQEEFGIKFGQETVSVTELELCLVGGSDHRDEIKSYLTEYDHQFTTRMVCGKNFRGEKILADTRIYWDSKGREIAVEGIGLGFRSSSRIYGEHILKHEQFVHVGPVVEATKPSNFIYEEPRPKVVRELVTKVKELHGFLEDHCQIATIVAVQSQELKDSISLDSMEVMAQVYEWALEFHEKHLGNNWEEDDWFLTLDAFMDEKFKGL